jgi:predicted ATPase
LLLIGAYRDNEVDSGHPLMLKLDAIRRAGTKVQDIILALGPPELCQLDASRMGRSRRAALDGFGVYRNLETVRERVRVLETTVL